MLLLRFVAAFVLSYLAGRLAKQLKFPPILGWLIIAMFLGRYGLDLLNEKLVAHPVYTTLYGVSQLALGSMIGITLVYQELKDKIKSVLMIGLFDIITTFVVVSAVFAVVLAYLHLPLIGSIIFGTIAVSTAPAPPVGLIQQYGCRGPLSDTVAPMTALNSVLINLIFFPMIAIIGAVASNAHSSFLLDILIVVCAPLVLGALVGFVASLFVKEKTSRTATNSCYALLFVVLYLVSSYLNSSVFTGTKMMTILAGMSFAAVYVNGIPAAKLRLFQKDFVPVHNYLFMFFIVNLSKDLNPFGLLTGGATMIIYVASRAVSKYLGNFIGAKISHAEEKVSKGIGIVMQPHSGVSIMFSGISAQAIAPLSPELASLITLTISAAALVIELISLPLSKKIYDQFGEIPPAQS